MKIACLNCGANLIFAPHNGQCYCHHCGNYSSIDILEKVMKLDDVIYNHYICSSCGAELISDENTIISNCAYCGSNELVKRHLEGFFQPKQIIPFKIDKNQALDYYKEYIKKNTKNTSKFIEELEIKSIYIPCYLTKHRVEFYDNPTAPLSGTARVSKFYEEDIFSYFDASQKVSNKIIRDLGPYYFEKNTLKKYSPLYTVGFQIEKGDQFSEKTEKYIEKFYIKEILSTRKTEISEFSDELVKNTKVVNLKKLETVQILIPVHFVSSKKNKKKIFAVNGQTGRVVSNIKFCLNKKKKMFSVLNKIITISMVILIFSILGLLNIIIDILKFGVFFVICIKIAAFLEGSYEAPKKRHTLKLKVNTWVQEKRKFKQDNEEKIIVSFLDKEEKIRYLNGRRIGHAYIRKEKYLKY